jgi:hypothetical protein
MGRTNQTQDRLDALLDGRPGEVTDDLAPLLAAAEALRAELADFELDPEVVDRHLEQALDRPATVVELPVRKAGGGVLRRRLVAAGLAAALLLVPATAASAASAEALPGQALYPVKLAVEQFHLAAVQWSPTREAQERAKLAARRLDELDRLVKLRMFRQVAPAIRALEKAVQAAEAAVVEAVEEGAAPAELVAVVDQLTDVAVEQHLELVALSKMANVLPRDVTLAVAESPALPAPNLPEVPPALQPVVTTVTTSLPQPEPSTPAASQPQPTSPPSSAPVQPTAPPASQPATTTTAPTTTTTTTPPTTQGPADTAGTAGAQGSPAGAGGAGTSTTSSTVP